MNNSDASQANTTIVAQHFWQWIGTFLSPICSRFTSKTPNIWTTKSLVNLFAENRRCHCLPTFV
uniref:Uncharacterized protein n=1 Tax=Anopheles albimanus TaxID=7167 RepID=A0A182FZG4_ANOAL